MNNLLQIAAAFLVLALSLAAFFGVLGVFFPARLGRTRQIMAELPGRSFWVGAVNFLFLGALAFVFAQLGNQNGGSFFYILAILLAAVLGVGASFGLGAAAETVGERLAPRAAGLWKTAAGTGLLSLACAFPFVGWFGLLPFALFSGLGGFILTFFIANAKVMAQP
jgi:hypothetical protein